MSRSLSRRSLFGMLASCPLCAEAAAASLPVCVPGHNQSPIELGGAKPVEVEKAIEIDYQSISATLKRSGESFKLYPASGNNSIKIDGEKYKLYEFHFHHPAEHLVGGTRHRMECHFVNKKENGDQLAVVGVFIVQGKEDNIAMKPIWDALPPADTEGGTHLEIVDLPYLLPKNLNGPLYRYNGSLTSAPFPAPDGLIWSIYQQTVEASVDQIRKYECMYPPNARPIQALEKREVKLLITKPK